MMIIIKAKQVVVKKTMKQVRVVMIKEKYKVKGKAKGKVKGKAKGKVKGKAKGKVNDYITNDNKENSDKDYISKSNNE